MQTVPPQQLIGAEWYRGTADAVYQNLPIIAGWGRFETAVLLAGDHILALDFSQMLAFHKAKQSVFTVCVMPVPTAEASRFGVLEVESDGRIISFEEKPKRPKEIPGRPGWSVISLGNYIAALDHLTRTLEANNQKPDSTHDFGQDIIPQLLHEGAPVYAYDFLTNVILGQSEHYWRDVGTVHAFWEANMDIVSITPELNVYNDHWIIRSPYDNLPPAKFIDTEGLGCRVANTVVSGGCIVQDSTLTKAVLGRKVCVYGSDIEASILFSRVNVGYGCKLRRVIIDEGVSLPPATSIGYDLEADRARGLYVDESGIVVVTRSFHF
jgi:glucose-1-phosphate adenylyltransferase